MKRCPQCRRDYYDDTLVYCLDDGNVLLEGPASADERATAILNDIEPASEAATRAQIHTTDQTAVLPGGVEAEHHKGPGDSPESRSKPMLAGIGILILLIIGGFLGYRYFGPTKQIGSIAVLPFVNQSGIADVDYLSDGVTESLINSLTDLQSLRVVARTTAFRYKGREFDPQVIGRELNVRAVLTGTVKQFGDTLDIQVDLVDATTGAQLWGKDYQRKTGDVLSVKQAIASEVTENLKLKLSGDEQKKLDKPETVSAEAYECYLRGRFLWNKRTPDGINRSIEEYQKAIMLDTNYAMGYTGLADAYALLEQIGGVPSSENLPKARAAADRALQLDDSLAEAHASSAKIYEQMWRWPEAEAEYKRSISLNPNYPRAHQWYALFLRTQNRFDEAMVEIKRAQELDPLSAGISANAAFAYLLKNDLNSAIEQDKKVLELDPGFWIAHSDMAWAYVKQQ
ncbi:MAG TPA: hypothetical protein VHQ01_12565, partial [Pyrinomonadaceae bacterium]|nr:hypothetical protein [Pyrinomonadaceae bacterium]